jgi:hypothetical protein
LVEPGLGLVPGDADGGCAVVDDPGVALDPGCVVDPGTDPGAPARDNWSAGTHRVVVVVDVACPGV